MPELVLRHISRQQAQHLKEEAQHLKEEEDELELNFKPRWLERQYPK
jgi:hypothetical protein